MPRTRTDRGRLPRPPLLALAVACAVLGLPGVAPAATAAVTIRDNAFSPRELHVEPGDTVVWTNSGTRVHDVTSDTGEFLSGDLGRGGRFTFTFEKEGFYYYHCSFHGRPRQGMWGVVVVGDPEPPHGGGGGKDERPRIDVPGDFRTIQGAVDAAEPGSTVVVAPGVYKGGVRIAVDDLVVRGVDRFRTVLDGGDRRSDGIVVEGARKVTVANLTVRGFTGAGIRFNGARRFTATRVDAIVNRTFGVRAERSYDGVIRNSFAWGSGDAAISVAQCMGCGVLVDEVYAGLSYTGYSGVNATGVTVRDSKFVRNGAGVVAATRPDQSHAPGRGTLVLGNLVQGNNDGSAPAPDGHPQAGVPLGTGIWLAGVQNNVVRDNELLDHRLYGIVVTATGDVAPAGNEVLRNRIRRAGHALAWDGEGSDNCFESNDFTDETAPAEIETLYACASRPFDGTPYPPVADAVAAAIEASLDRATEEPPEPQRPRCQKGRPGCHRH